MNNTKHTILQTLFSSFLGGIYISFGCLTFLLINDPVVAALSFGIGILTVMNFGGMLVTKAIPMHTYNRSVPIFNIIIIYIGNLFGAIFFAFLLSLTRTTAKIKPVLETLFTAKTTDNPISLIALGILCAIFVALAVFSAEIYGSKSPITIFYVLFFIGIFILSGFEHIVANFFYFALYSFSCEFDVNIAKNILFVTIGNVIGGAVSGFVFKKISAK